MNKIKKKKSKKEKIKKRNSKKKKPKRNIERLCIYGTMPFVFFYFLFNINYIIYISTVFLRNS